MTEKFVQTALRDLNLLTRALWGNPQATLKHDDRSGLEYIDLSGHTRAFTLLFGAAVPASKKIMVREEYRMALKTLETATIYDGGVCITGQPGIGKTLFLAYVLVKRLGKRQAVAWHLWYSCGNLHYAMLRETASLHHEGDTDPLYAFRPIWGLSDSNSTTPQPPQTFYGTPDCVTTIQAASSREYQCRKWCKYPGAERYVMDIWSEEEIEGLARLLGVDIKRMTLLAKKWGGVPRDLLRLLKHSDKMTEISYRNSAATCVMQCREMLSTIQVNAYPDETVSPFYLCRPRIHPEGGALRMLSRAVIPTATLCSLLAEALLDLDSFARVSFFRVLRQHDGTRSASGYIFENWLHSFFLASRTMECHWLQGLTGVSMLQGVASPIPASWSDVSVARPPYYWVAPTEFASIDCALVLETGIYAIQVILSSGHSSPIKDLQALRENLPEDLKDLPWRVLFVGDDTDSAEAAAKKWLGKVAFPPKQAPLAIGWSALDPVNLNGSWKEYRNKIEPQPDEGRNEALMQVDERASVVVNGSL